MEQEKSEFKECLDSFLRREQIETGILENLLNVISKENLIKLEDKVISTKDTYSIYNFAYWGNVANKAKLEKAIIETNDSKYIYYFAKEVPGANIDKLYSAIVKMGNSRHIEEFKKNIFHIDEEDSNQCLGGGVPGIYPVLRR